MWRRKLIGGLVGTVAFSLAAGAQTPDRVYRLGASCELGRTPKPSPARSPCRNWQDLASLKAAISSSKRVVGELEALPGLMRELLAGQPDAVVAVGPAIVTAGTATRTVPVVTFGFDPIELGLAANYARPGGNVTGVVILIGELEGKRLSLLLEAVPDRRRVAALVPAGSAANETALRKAAAGLGVELLVFPVAAPSEYKAAFAAMRAQGAQALVIGATPQFQRDGKQLAALALEARLPTVCEWAEMAQVGCLIGYGPSRTALRKRMADQIAKIFRGAAPGELPIERPTVFEFAVNQKIAKSLDLSIPSAVIARADEVIE